MSSSKSSDDIEKKNDHTAASLFFIDMESNYFLNMNLYLSLISDFTEYLQVLKENTAFAMNDVQGYFKSRHTAWQ